MNCEKCDLIFARIKIARENVKDCEQTKDFYNHKLGHSLIYGFHKDVVKDYQKKTETSFINWIEAVKEQKEIHLKLNRHYKKHLDGRKV